MQVEIVVRLIESEGRVLELHRHPDDLWLLVSYEHVQKDGVWVDVNRNAMAITKGQLAGLAAYRNLFE